VFREGRRIRLGVPNPHLIVPLPDSSMRVIDRRGTQVFPASRRYHSSGTVMHQHRKMTVRCTTKLMHVAVPWATTNAAVISPRIGGSNASITAFIPT
jgi:hypothetical protein